ncbi:MAG: class I tRNA ligase family protein [Candidatus Brocadiaceae bacterium]
MLYSRSDTKSSSILQNLVKLSAPIIVHTAEEVWSAILYKDEDVSRVHLTTFPKCIPARVDNALNEKWEKLIAHSLEASVNPPGLCFLFLPLL